MILMLSIPPSGSEAEIVLISLSSKVNYVSFGNSKIGIEFFIVTSKLRFKNVGESVKSSKYRPTLKV